MATKNWVPKRKTLSGWDPDWYQAIRLLRGICIFREGEDFGLRIGTPNSINLSYRYHLHLVFYPARIRRIHIHLAFSYLNHPVSINPLLYPLWTERSEELTGEIATSVLVHIIVYYVGSIDLLLLWPVRGAIHTGIRLSFGTGVYPHGIPAYHDNRVSPSLILPDKQLLGYHQTEICRHIRGCNGGMFIYSPDHHGRRN